MQSIPGFHNRKNVEVYYTDDRALALLVGCREGHSACNN